MAERLIMEPIEPHPGTYDTRMMARGEPGIPRRFDWRETTYVVAEILDTWKETSEDRGDIYVRRHGLKIRTACGAIMRLTGARSVRGRAPRWILRSVEAPST